MPKKVTEKWLARTFDEVIARRPLPKANQKFREIREELVCFQGVPDFVATTETRPPTQRARAAFAAAVAFPSRARVASLLSPSKVATPEELSRASGLSLRTVRTSLAALVKAELAIAKGTGGYRLTSQFGRHMIELWAFELKLGDWNRALYQALQYKAFAHRVAIVMSDRELARFRPRISSFRKNGIGVYAVSLARKRVRIVLEPVPHTPSSRFQYVYAVGQFLSPRRNRVSGRPAASQRRRRRRTHGRWLLHRARDK